MKSFEEEEQSRLYTNSYNDLPSLAEIDHIIVLVIMKILREKMNVEIDMKAIDDCLYIMKKHDFSQVTQDFELLKNDVDNTLDAEEKELEEKSVEFNREYVVCKTRIDNLDFIKNL